MSVQTHFLASQEQLQAAKEAAREDTAIWRTFHFATAAQAVGFANITPVQVAGQFGMTDSPGGGYDGYYFY
jgi:hypothetical protein